MIQAKIVADSLNSWSGDRLTTMLITFPRHILAELNTHRMLSKNSASSRAIPFEKMVKSVKENPFIPIAWQKDHKGMQGNKYFTNAADIFMYKKLWKDARDKNIEISLRLGTNSSESPAVTKQLCNRLLEPFMWHTVLISGTEWENFFSLRCPEYELLSEQMPISFRSKKDLLKYVKDVEAPEFKNQYDNLSDLDWLQINKGQAEIHMMALAENMWDAYNESIPKKLKPGQWHIPFEDKILPINDWGNIEDQLTKVKASTAICARTSYTVMGDEKDFNINKQIELHDRMIKQVPFHASPFEHCALVMPEEEYNKHIKGYIDGPEIPKECKGWSRNFKGFKQYRDIIENEK